MFAERGKPLAEELKACFRGKFVLKYHLLNELLTNNILSFAGVNI